jgi:hypothetical protein
MLFPPWLEPYRKRLGFRDFGGDHFPGHETLNRGALFLAYRERNPDAILIMKRYPIHPLSALFPPMTDEEFAELKESIKKHGLRDKIVLFDGQILDGRNREAACHELKIPPVFRNFDPSLDGDSVVDFVADKNLTRRSLSTSQRAAVAADLVPFFADQVAAAKAAKAKADADKKGTGTAEKPADSAPPEVTGSDAGKSTDSGDKPAESSPAPAETGTAAKPVETGKTAAALAAEASGVSERSVQTAAALKKDAPEELEKVKRGEKSLAKAAKDAKDAKQQNRANGEDVTPYRAECSDLLEGSHGDEFAKSVRNSSVLKTTPELKDFMALPIPEQKAIVPFLVKGWKVAKALQFHRGEFDDSNTVGHLIAAANAKGGEITVEIAGFTITVERSGAPEKPASEPAKAPEAAAAPESPAPEETPASEAASEQSAPAEQPTA